MTKKQMEILINIIGAVESGGQIYGNRNYGAYAAPYTNSSIEYTCTLGWAQNYGVEAQKLCQMIFNKDSASFRKADTANIENKLKTDWVATRWNPSSSEKKALVAIITTDVGKQCQDELFAELMDGYIKKALAYDPTMSVAAQMMWCEISHLGGSGATTRIFSRASKPYTVDSIYASLLLDQNDSSSNNQFGDKKFQSRHECCVKWIKQYLSDTTTTTTTTTTGGNSMAKIKGIDVSYHNGVIQWDKAAKDGVKFAVIREGYRKTIDEQFLANVKGTLANNIVPMIYHFVYTDGATIKQNAESTVNNIKKSGLNHETVWIWVDIEYDTWKKNGESCTRERCSKYTKEYIDALKSLGCKNIGIYMNNDYYKNYYSTELIKGFPIWLADYSGDADYSCVMQQYTSSGKVNGMSGNVDMNYLFDSNYLTGKVISTSTNKEDTTGGEKMTENQLRSAVANWMVPYIGISEGSTSHKNILAVFNNSGLCSRYRMTVNDAWCATAVSAAFIACGLAGKAGSGSLFECVECSCWYMVELAKKQGIWVENDAYVPKVGDVVLYDWDDNGVGDNTGTPDHVGIVFAVSGNTLTIIEGNYSDSVKKRTLAVNARYIRGYITPNYAKKAGTVSNIPTPSTPTVSQTVTKPQSSSTFNKTCKFVGVINTDELNIRKGAGTDWDTCSFSPLKKGTEVEVCDTCSNGWYYIKYDNKYGFCSNKYVVKKAESTGTTEPKPSTSSKDISKATSKSKFTISGTSTPNKSEKAVGEVTASSLNVRTWAGTENGKLKSYPTLGKGNLVSLCDSILGSDGDTWYYIKIANKYYGFVHSDYIKRK